jgi:hypothetical protein
MRRTGAFFGAAFDFAAGAGIDSAGVTLFVEAGRGSFGVCAAGVGLEARAFFATADCEATFFPVAFFGGILG